MQINNNAYTMLMISSKCKKCSKVKTCSHKRLEACNLLPTIQDSSKNLTKPFTKQSTTVTIKMGEYGNIETNLEEIKHKISNEINQAFSLEELKCK